MVLETHRADHAHSVLIFARDIISAMSDKSVSQAGLKIRVGIHTGPVIAGLIGKKRSVYDVWGETVNLASRLEATGKAGHIQISKATKDALGPHGRDAQARDHVVKGVGRIRNRRPHQLIFWAGRQQARRSLVCTFIWWCRF